MKNLMTLLLVLLTLPLVSCAQEPSNDMIIGKIVNDKFIITANEKDIKDMFEVTLKKDNNANITNLQIKKDIVEGTNDMVYYYLLGSNNSNSTKIVTLLILKNNEFIAKTLTGSGGGGAFFPSSVTCSGSCIQGCDPKRWVDDYNDIVFYCSECQLTGKTCNKSVTEEN